MELKKVRRLYSTCRIACGAMISSGIFILPAIVQITPSLVFPRTTFVDMDQRAQRFFRDPQARNFADRKKYYVESTNITFLAQDYSKELAIDADYDLLLSQYTGFVSEKCKKYLPRDGILVSNDSHGDASLASIDNDFRLMAVINRRGKCFWFFDNLVDDYFVPKSNVEVTSDLLCKSKRGIEYTRSASNYIFEK